jgi:cytochrome c-type biogenesis protein CcmH
MKKIGYFISTLLLMLTISLIAVPVEAQDREPTDDEVNAIAKQLFCPVCENTPLDVCPTLACQDWRDEIRQKLAEGWTEDQIKQYFVDRHGMQVLAVPQARGINWLLFILPPVVFIVGAIVLWRVVRSWHQGTPIEDPLEEPEIDDPYVSRLEEELRRRS